jgi:hypothetical protein
MSITLKRPMFRRGGSTNTGIMSGLVDRTNYENGAFGNMTEDQIRSNIDMLVGLQNQFAPVSKTRIPIGEIGFALASGAPVTEALLSGYRKFVTEDDKRRALMDKRKQAAVSTVLGQALKTPKDTSTDAVKNALAQGFKPGTKAFNEYIQSVTVKEDASTAAIRNANALEQLGYFKTDADKAKYIQAATIKGGGFNIQFNDDGTIKSIAEGETKDPNKNKILEVQQTAFQLNNAGSSLVKELKGAKVGAVGSIINALDSTGAQISQAAQAFGINSKENLDLSEGTPEIDNYLTKNFGNALANDAIKFGKVKSVAIQLAYIIAKTDDPGGRLSDKDIAFKMEEMGLGSNPEKTIAILTNVIDIRNKNLNYTYNLLTDGKNLDFTNMDAVGSFANNLQKEKNNQGKIKDEQKEKEKEIFDPLNILKNK